MIDFPGGVRYNGGTPVNLMDKESNMEVKLGEHLRSLRRRDGRTQEDLAVALDVTPQAVSRWETGETVPNVDTLKLLSKQFDVSINTILGSPRKLTCQCCGMPMEEDSILSREPDGAINEESCQWCYTDGAFTYPTMESLIDYLSTHFSSEQWPEAAARAYYAKALPKLAHWQGA